MVFDSVTDGIIVTDLNGLIIEVNDGARRIFGLDNKDQLINENSTSFLKPHDRDEIIINEQESFQPVQEYTHLYRLQRADGTGFTAEINGSVIRDATDYPVGFVTVVRDITKRMEAEELYRTLANSSPVGVYIVQDGKCRFVNSQFQKYMGYSEDEMLGMVAFELVHPDDRERVRQSAVDMVKPLPRAGRSSGSWRRLPPSAMREGRQPWVTSWISPSARRQRRH
jgi:PAS domain S-box-containing protein